MPETVKISRDDLARKVAELCGFQVIGFEHQGLAAKVWDTSGYLPHPQKRDKEGNDEFFVLEDFLTWPAMPILLGKVWELGCGEFRIYPKSNQTILKRIIHVGDGEDEDNIELFVGLTNHVPTNLALALLSAADGRQYELEE